MLHIFCEFSRHSDFVFFKANPKIPLNRLAGADNEKPQLGAAVFICGWMFVLPAALPGFFLG
jgi:hypothetical protein